MFRIQYLGFRLHYIDFWKTGIKNMGRARGALPKQIWFCMFCNCYSIYCLYNLFYLIFISALLAVSRN